MPETTAIEVVRDDGVLVGRVIAVDDVWRAETIFGAALDADVDSFDEAEEIALREGLSSLIDPWWFSVPDGTWVPGWIVEVHRDRIRVSWEDPKYFQGNPEWFAVSGDNVRRYEPSRD